MGSNPTLTAIYLSNGGAAARVLLVIVVGRAFRFADPFRTACEPGFSARLFRAAETSPQTESAERTARKGCPTSVASLVCRGSCTGFFSLVLRKGAVELR